MSDAPETAHLEDGLEVLRELLDRLPCECGVRRPPWGGTEFHVCRRCHDWKVVSERIRALAAERDALHARVAELEEALEEISQYGPPGLGDGGWMDGEWAVQRAERALAKVKEAHDG